MPTFDLEYSAHALDALAHARQPQMLVGVVDLWHGHTRPLIVNLDQELLPRDACAHLLSNPAGMAVRVTERLLDRSIERDLN